jgi:predicted DNA-binding transcriptional regulator AlpA
VKATEITPAIEPLAVRAERAAAMCGLSQRHWFQLQAAGKIPAAIKCGRASLWRVDDLRRWVEWGCPNLDRFEQLLRAEEGGK